MPLFDATITEQFGIEYAIWESPLADIFHMGTMNGRYTDSQNWEMYGLPVSRWPGEGIAQGQFRPTYGKRFTPVNYGLGDILAYEDWDDDQTGTLTKVLPSKGGALARSHRTLREVVAAAFFKNIAFAAEGNNTPQTSDGRPTFSTAHPVSMANSGTTKSNRAGTPSDLSFTTYDAAHVNLIAQKAPNDTEFLPNKPRIMVVNQVNHRIADQLFKNEWQPNTADRNRNTYQGAVRVIEWPYFQVSGSTGTNNAWFVVAETHSLQFLVRQEPKITTDYAIGVQAYIFASTSRFVCGARDWRGLYGNKGA